MKSGREIRRGGPFSSSGVGGGNGPTLVVMVGSQRT